MCAYDHNNNYVHDSVSEIVNHFFSNVTPKSTKNI